MSAEKRGPGRPKKMPEGDKFTIRCVLVNGEKERFDQAKELSELSQVEFTRAAVMHAVDDVLGLKPGTPKPKRKK